MNPIRVLVVDDSPTVRAALITILEQSGDIQVIDHAANGREAVEKAVQLHPDLITMDVEMPDMDGVEATLQIMAWHPTPILIVTAYADSPKLHLAFEAMKAGALDIVPKPTAFGQADDPWETELVIKVRQLARLRPRTI